MKVRIARLVGLFLPVAASLATGVAAHAACGPASAVLVEVAVREAPLVIERNLSVADLQAMSAQLGGRVAHPILGLYAGTVGYTVRDLQVVVGPPGAFAQARCPGLRIQADLVVVDRRIVIASDLSGTSCLLGAALDHYRRHATAAQVALQEFPSSLPAAIAPEVDTLRAGAPRYASGRRP